VYEEFVGVLRQRAAEVRQAKAAAADRGDARLVQAHTVDLEEREYLALSAGIGIAPAASPAATQRADGSNASGRCRTPPHGSDSAAILGTRHARSAA